MTSTIIISILLITSGYSGISGINCEEVEVTLKLGTISGYKYKVDEKYVNAFLGIPFAEPPIGDLRFRKPIPITKKGNRKLVANKLPKYCMQDLAFIEPDNEVSEDCLYLNIWSPVNLEEDFTQNLKPVMVFIHGGIFIFWGSPNKHYNGSVLSSFGDVVVVTINYRLGAFGFLSTGNDDAPGNVGLYDQALALEWINENIAYFGGDANKVTAFGESAGAMSITLHLISPLVHNIINRAILMSGAAYVQIAVENKESAIRKAKKMAQLLGCNNKEVMSDFKDIDIECLRKADAEQIVKLQTSPEIPQLSTSLAKAWFVPIFGEPFIPKKTKEMLREGYLIKGIDLLVGTMLDEGQIIQFLFDHIHIPPKAENWHQAMQSFLTHFFKDLSSAEREKLIAFYFNDVHNKRSDQAKMAYITALGDIYFNCETVYFSEIASKFNNLHQYLNEYLTSNPKDHPIHYDINMASHTYELPLTFGTVSEQKDFEVSKKWMKIVTDFAKTGIVEWPKHGNESIPYYVFKGDESSDQILNNFRSEACTLWKPILEKNY